MYLAAELLRMMDGVEAVLSQTVGIPIPEVGKWRGLPPEVAFGEAAAMGVFTAAANIMGAPAASVPAELLDDRWPIGVQLAARPGQDALVLQLSHQLEHLSPWRGRWAPGARAA